MVSMESEDSIGHVGLSKGHGLNGKILDGLKTQSVP